MTSRATEKSQIAGFVHVVTEANTTNLQLLRDIEQTVSWLDWLENGTRNNVAYGIQLSERVRMGATQKIIDDDGSICALLEACEHGLSELHELLGAKKGAAERAVELQGDHLECVVGAYERAMTAVKDMNDSMAELKWSIGEHDADLETPAGPAISDPDQLQAYLSAL